MLADPDCCWSHAVRALMRNIIRDSGLTQCIGTSERPPGCARLCTMIRVCAGSAGLHTQQEILLHAAVTLTAEDIRTLSKAMAISFGHTKWPTAAEFEAGRMVWREQYPGKKRCVTVNPIASSKAEGSAEAPGAHKVKEMSAAVTSFDAPARDAPEDPLAYDECHALHSRVDQALAVTIQQHLLCTLGRQLGEGTAR